MLKSIFVATLFFNLLATSNAVAGPLALFIEQCLQYQPDLGQDSLVTFQSFEQQAVEFEKRTIALNNINDRIQYYRPFANDNLSRQGLLWCQLHLADEFYALATAPKTQSLIDQLQHLAPPYNQFAQRLVAIKRSQWTLIKKSKLHSAQASINQALSSRQFTLQFNQQDCVLTNAANTDEAIKHESTTNIDISIAKYLIKQPNELCRKQAWLAYQVRTKDQQAPALALIHQLQQQHAMLQEYGNTAQAQLSSHGLTPLLLAQFLAEQTTNLNIAPWNIAQALGRASKSSNMDTVTANAFLQQILQSLKPLDLKFELIIVEKSTIDKDPSTDDSQHRALSDTQIIRVWHQQRLLGEIFTYPPGKLQPGVNVDGQLIKQTVVGHQFGQYVLSFPQQLTRTTQQHELINALSQAIVSLAQGGQFYFLNHRGQNSDAHAIATQWLVHYIKQQLSLPLQSERSELAANYQKQLWVFRAKVALAFYQYEGDLKRTDQDIWLAYNQQLSDKFEQSFGQPWPNATDAIYSYQAIANEGINHYLPLWQTALAQLVIAQTPPTISTRDIFNLLVVNETDLTLNDKLEQLIGPPIDPHSLIRRFKHAGTTQE
ncbi:MULTISPECIES: hypothetical protein [Shewanella]|uniref:Uncharacterized protein n=1 Tax=Shewanella psychromarinicola TaxID=2487742 RepID=A0A3N4E3G8_9GAMM|nr:hypothetical protein [Shewanella psychromarinicola]AZG36057.1 hypothetical protein EGC80_15020 [Shewanella psychromarinicola]MCL1080426.1 hypothetical protein [Shewanella psychromarinicola]RPA31746.1 hypothetical protein EGC77_12505 [Shewanella psychromarinicola]